jgi:hypothetical protein
VILAVGGGSTIDCSKAIATGVYYEGDDLWQMVASRHGVLKALPLVDILTLSATGSEYDGGGVITNLKTNEKLGNMYTYPSASICDPTYTELRPMYFYDYNTNKRYSQPFWVMGRATNVHEVQDGEYSWLDGDLVYGVASLDGSVVLPLQFCYVEPLTVGFAGFRSWDTVDFDVYNNQGERLFGAAELADEFAGGSYVNIQYGQGYYTVGSYIGDENVTYAEGEGENANTWTLTVSNLPKYVDGELQTYSWIETIGQGSVVTIISARTKKGYAGIKAHAFSPTWPSTVKGSSFG